jgi:hypothetical protein
MHFFFNGRVNQSYKYQKEKRKEKGKSLKKEGPLTGGALLVSIQIYGLCTFGYLIQFTKDDRFVELHKKKSCRYGINLCHICTF